jgi:hypothetical protein
MNKRVVTIASVVLPLAALAVFLLILRQNAILRKQLTAKLSSSDRFYAGDRLDRLQVADMQGRSTVLELKDKRIILAVVQPSCASCELLIRGVRPGSNTAVLSLATAAETRPIVEPVGIAPMTFSIAGQPLDPKLAAKLSFYPQILLVDRGAVVRTCASLDYCR